MAPYTENGARDVARDLIKAALESGSLKLIGPFNDMQAQANGAADAEYLATLLKTLSDKISA